MPWPAEITTAGVSMLNSAIAGETLHFTKAYALGGTAPDATGRAYEITLLCPIARVERASDTVTVIVRIEKTAQRLNDHSGAAFTMDEVDLYAKIGNGNEAIFCTVSSSTGTPIPAVNDEASFAMDFKIPIALANTATVNVSVENSVYVTENRLQTVASSLNAKISALESKLTEWVIGLLDKKNTILAGWVHFTIASDAWQYDSVRQYYYVQLPGTLGIAFPSSSLNLPLAIFHVYPDSKKAAADCGFENIVAIHRFQSSSTSPTGRICSIYAYAASEPEATITGTCFILSPQSVTAPVEETEEPEEEFVDSISDITVSGAQVSAVISCGCDGARAYCVLYDSSGESSSVELSIDSVQQAVTKGQNTYTFTLGHAFSSGNTLTITTMKDYHVLATQTYTEEAEELPADP